MKAKDGKYHINGKVYDKLEGSRAEVGHGTAYKTSGGLLKKDLFYKVIQSKKGKTKGRWISLKKHQTAKKEKRLEKHGYFAQKGKFGYVKKTPKSKSPKKSKSKTRRARTLG